jgi:cytochrome P450
MPISAPLAPMPPSHLLLGHLPERTHAPLELFLGSQRALGDVVRYRMGYVYVEQLTHPDHVRHVLVEATTRYTKGSIWDKMRPLVGVGLLTAEGDDWKRQRRIAQPAFHRDGVARLATTMTDTIGGHLRSWEPAAAANDELLVFPEMRQLTLDVVTRALFGTDLADYTSITDAFTRALDVTNARIISPAPYLPRLYRIPTPANLRFRRAVASLDAVVGAIIARRQNESSATGHDDLLGMLMAESEPGARGAEARQLRDSVMTLLLGGYETTATTLAWAFHLLGRYPDVASTMRSELQVVLGGRTPSVADLPDLTYVRCVVEETMRLYPAVWAVPRIAAEDDEVGGYRIPRGDIVVLVPYVTHRHPDFWPDPERFDPSRFLPANRTGAPRWAYFPFGGGQRQCIGNTFAMMEAQFVLAMVAQRFVLQADTDAVVEPDASVTLRPRGTMPMRISAPAAAVRTDDAGGGA